MVLHFYCWSVIMGGSGSYLRFREKHHYIGTIR